MSSNTTILHRLYESIHLSSNQQKQYHTNIIIFPRRLTINQRGAKACYSCTWSATMKYNLRKSYLTPKQEEKHSQNPEPGVVSLTRRRRADYTRCRPSDWPAPHGAASRGPRRTGRSPRTRSADRARASLWSCTLGRAEGRVGRLTLRYLYRRGRMGQSIDLDIPLYPWCTEV